ncbi:MAG TPA: hypothetical protein VGH43_10425 [Jatrophihabitans sp.]
MTEQTPQDPYAGKPYYGPPQQPYGQYPPQGYGQQYPQQYQSYPQQPGYSPYPQYAPYQYQPYPYPYQRPPDRPGTATTAAVLAFVAGGLLIVASLFLFAGASLINDLGDELNQSTGPATSELAIDGVINLIASGLLIAGGVMVAGRKLRGRNLLTTGSGIVVACSIYWLVRFDHSFGGTVFYAVLFSALVVISVSMAFTTTSRAWLTAAPSTKPAT